MWGWELCVENHVITSEHFMKHMLFMNLKVYFFIMFRAQIIISNVLLSTMYFSFYTTIQCGNSDFTEQFIMTLKTSHCTSDESIYGGICNIFWLNPENRESKWLHCPTMEMV